MTDEQKAMEWVDRVMLSCGAHLEDIREEDCTGRCEYDDLCMEHRKTLRSALEPKVATREWVEKLSARAWQCGKRIQFEWEIINALKELGTTIKED